MPAKSATKTPKVIKPLNATEFEPNNVEYSTVKNNTEIATKWVDTTYSRGDSNQDSDKKFLMVARGCIIKSFKKVENKDKDGKELPKKEGKKDKYQIFMGLKDEKFIEKINQYEEKLISVGVENSAAWFDSEMNEEECRDMLKPVMSHHEKYGYAIGGILGREFTCKSKTDDVPDVSDLTVALGKNNIVDVCFCFNKVKLGVGKYNIGLEINQVNIMEVGSNSEYESTAILPEDYVSGKITLTPRQQHDKGGRFCKALYDEKPLRFRLENVTGRIFKFEKDDTISYSMSIRLNDPTIRKMIENMDEDIFNILLANSKDYFDSKKTSKLLKTIVKSMYSYNKTDQDKIKKGEKPTYDPSIWIKIYHTTEKGFDGKVVNVEDNKALQNTEELLNKDLSISSIEIYSRHIWFGPKGTSINLTLNKCAISYDVPVYDMDDAGEAAGEDDEVEEVTEAVNSDGE
jgi:hypothetical protein